MRPGPEVDVVGAQGDPGELGVRVGVLNGGPPADQDADPAGVAGRGEPAAAASSASGHDATRSSPDASSRTIGEVSRSAAVVQANAQRPLSQFHSSLTAGSSPASRRSTIPRRWSTRSAQPEAQCSHTPGVDTRSNGRERNR